ncbi:MAG: hypothetical protein AB2A00_24775 [Myxococcota bacterium]
MNPMVSLLNLACGQPLPTVDDSRARRLQLVVAGMLLALILSAVWGLAAGSSSLALALGNLVKVPLVLLLSSMAAVPAGMLAWKLSGAKIRGTDVLASFTTGVFSAGLVLAVLSPLVALYYHSSTWAGPMLAMGSVFASISVATFVFIRNILRSVPRDVSRSTVLFTVAVFLGMQLATLLQLIALFAPILPELTVFDGGIDRVVGH